MGRTTPTYRDAIRGLEREWAPMGRALRRPYRDDFDRLFDRARAFADAAGYANPPDPERAFVLSLVLAHEIEIRRLHERIDALEAELGESTGTDVAVAQSAATAESTATATSTGSGATTPSAESGTTAESAAGEDHDEHS